MPVTTLVKIPDGRSYTFDASRNFHSSIYTLIKLLRARKTRMQIYCGEEKVIMKVEDLSVVTHTYES